MALNFIDILYGSISFPEGEDTSLVIDLISAPEVQRLRFLRLLNHDAPFMQEVATARRFAHSIGTCFASFRLLNGAPWMSLRRRKEILAASLIHDIGILPYGHLIEKELARLDSSFSHESLVRNILRGTYHPTNIYHQILPNASLKVADILRRFEVDPDEVFKLICPPHGMPTLISGAIDLDNIDNIHRMAALLGRVGARKNVRRLLDHLSVDAEMHLVFEPTSLQYVRRSLKYRQIMYVHMIGHPSCVAYNAFLQDLARRAVELGVIDHSTWYLNEADLESRLLSTHELRDLSYQLRTGCRYRLLDYVWANLDANGSRAATLISEQTILSRLGSPPVARAEHRIWIERDKVNRLLHLRVRGHDLVNMGAPSTVLLVALIDPGLASNSDCLDFQRLERSRWREHVQRVLEGVLPEREVTFWYPENFPFFGGQQIGSKQLQLFQKST